MQSPALIEQHKKSFTFIIFLCFVGLSLNSSIIPTIEFITSKRIAFVLLVTIFIALVPYGAMNSLTHMIRTKLNFITAFLLFQLTVWAIFVYIIQHTNTETEGLYFIFLAVMQLICFMIFVSISAYIDILFFFRLTIVFGLALFAFPLAFAFFAHELSGNMSMRFYLDDIVPEGINRYLNFLTVCISSALTVLILRKNQYKNLKFLSICVLIASILFFFITSSRQFLISSIAIFIVLYAFIGLTLTGMLRTIILSAFLFVCSLYLLNFLPDSAVQNLISRLTSTSFFGGDGNYDVAREFRYNEMLIMSYENPIFGVGPNGVYYFLGLKSDSAWLQIVAELGIFQSLIFIFLLIFIYWQLLVNYFYNVKIDRVYTGVYLAFATCFFINTAVLMFVNDIVLEMYFWLLIPICSAIVKKCQLKKFNRGRMCLS